MALIDKAEILLHRKIDKSVRDEKINPHIDDAEFLDLKPLIGEEFYSDLVDRIELPIYAELLVGKIYTYNNIKYEFKGLKKVLSIFAFARYTMFGSATSTPFGTVEKNYKDSRNLEVIEKKSIYTKERQDAVQYFNDIVKYLDRHSDLYPYWRFTSGECHTEPNHKIRITKIT